MNSYRAVLPRSFKHIKWEIYNLIFFTRIIIGKMINVVCSEPNSSEDLTMFFPYGHSI